MPESFVLKANNGSGDVVIVKDKCIINRQEIIDHFSNIISGRVGLASAEPHYLKIKPKIVAEMLLKPENGIIIDYKVFCFNGFPYYIQTECNKDPFDSHKADFALFDLNWKRLDDYMTPKYRNDTPVECPSNLPGMLEYARICHK